MDKLPYWRGDGWYKIGHTDMVQLGLLQPIAIPNTDRKIVVKWAERNRGFHTNPGVYLWIFCISNPNSYPFSSIVKALNEHLSANSIGHLHYVIGVEYA